MKSEINRAANVIESCLHRAGCCSSDTQYTKAATMPSRSRQGTKKLVSGIGGYKRIADHKHDLRT